MHDIVDFRSDTLTLPTPAMRDAMPGWRLGFVCGNPRMIHALARIKSYLDYGAFQPIQIAGIVALESDRSVVKEIVELHRKRRDVLVDGLNKIGWCVPKPKGTMFVWASIPDSFRAMPQQDRAASRAERVPASARRVCRSLLLASRRLCLSGPRHALG